MTGRVNRKQLKQKNNKDNDLSQIKAENIHLKWQLQTIQKEYEIQSLKFI